MELKRAVSAAFLAALRAGFHPAVMVYLDWPGAPVYVHSGVGNISFDGQSWLGAGGIGGIDIPEERSGIVATEAALTLSGIPPSSYDLMADIIRNRPAKMLMALTTERSGNILIGVPVELFSGYMDGMKFSTQADGEDLIHSIAIAVASGPGARSVASITHSYEDQISKYPGDTAGRHLVHNAANLAKLTWPET